jgi:hypothetical protein
LRIKVDGKELDLDEATIRIREMCEAEKALGMSMVDATAAGSMAIMLFIALRRDDQEIGPGALADLVLDTNITAVSEVEGEDARPPDVDATGKNQESPQISGPRPLVPSA